MVPFKGFLVVAAACFTSGLAGVYFEMVLKNSTADLWVRNVQLRISLFSLLPALVPIIMAPSHSPMLPRTVSPRLHTCLQTSRHGPGRPSSPRFSGGASHSPCDQIRRQHHEGLSIATSLSIMISFLVSVGLFHFCNTALFIIGASVVLTATCLYSQPDCKQRVSCTVLFKFLRARRTSNAPLPVSPMPTRPARCPAQSTLTSRLRLVVLLHSDRLSLLVPYCTTPAPPALASMRSYSMPSTLPLAATAEPPV
jgi:UDP-sugar transporter A1/2/3